MMFVVFVLPIFNLSPVRKVELVTVTVKLVCMICSKVGQADTKKLFCIFSVLVLRQRA